MSGGLRFGWAFPHWGARVRGFGVGWVLVVVAVFAVLLAPVSVSGVSAQSDLGGLVRVWARRLPSGNVEMGLSVDGVNVVYDNRYFPYSAAAVNVWYRSEGKVVASQRDGDRQAVLQIQVRKLPSGNLEFGLRVNGRDSWLPRARYFHYRGAGSDTTPRFSSAYVIGQTTPTPTEGATPADAEEEVAAPASACLGTGAVAVPNPGTNTALLADCETLLEIKAVLAGSSPTLNWAKTRAMSSWTGITIASVTARGVTTQRVVGVVLDNQSLNGTIPASISRLAVLRQLRLQNNDLHGSVPATLGSLVYLTSLSLRNNPRLTGCIPATLSGRVGLTVDSDLQYCGVVLPPAPAAPSAPSPPSSQVPAAPRPPAVPVPPRPPALASLSTNAACTNGTVIPAHATESALVWDCSALLEAKSTLEGTGGYTLNWGATTAMTSWNGITIGTVNSAKRVIRIRVTSQSSWLSSQQLKGSIPAVLGRLSELQELRITGQDMSGSFPADLGHLTKLTHIYLENSGFSGSIPAAWGNLRNLISLDIHEDGLSGSIPKELGKLTNLKYLQLLEGSLGSADGVLGQLSGPIPRELGHLTNLVRLFIQEQSITGPLPAELGNLTSLETMIIRRNSNLTGPIPAEFGNLSSLKTMILNGNSLSGSIPTVWQFYSLEVMNLANNSLTGSIPGDIFYYTVVLQELHLNNNGLTGSIPAAIAVPFYTLTHFNLSHNSLTGTIPWDLGYLTKIHCLCLNDNNLSGSIDWYLGEAVHGTGQFRLQNNELTGSIPAHFLYSSRRQINRDFWLWGNNLRGPFPAPPSGWDYSTKIGPFGAIWTHNPVGKVSDSWLRDHNGGEAVTFEGGVDNPNLTGCITYTGMPTGNHYVITNLVKWCST